MDCNAGSLWESGLYCNEEASYLGNEDEEHTPAKTCVVEAQRSKDSDQQRLSQCKRRRTLQFDAEVSDEIFAFTKSNEEQESLDEILPAADPWSSDFTDATALSYDAVDQDWLSDCMALCSDTEVPDLRIDISDFLTDDTEDAAVKERSSKKPSNVIFKESKSLARTSSVSGSSVAYPFAFIKPCGIEGSVTLKEINQRIRIPETRQKVDDAYPTSAFSGKPVVGKTKILTDGGKGSITIMRTRG